jgi:hypothetical protein
MSDAAAEGGGAEEEQQLSLAMFYLFGDAPQLLAFEAQDDAVRCRWLMRAIGFAAEDIVPMPTQVSPYCRSFCL